MTKKSTKSKAKKAVRKASKPVKKPSQKSPKPVTKSATKPSKASQFKSPYPRATGNPFRETSAYAICFDVLHAHPDGISRQQLVTEVAKITKKDEKHSAYDCAVLLSSRENGERHQSCRSGFWVERTNDHLILHVTAPKTAGN